MQHVALRITISVICLILVAIHVFFPHVNLDAITLALLVGGALPWLQPILKTIKLPGGIEITLQELKQEIKAAAGAAQSAELKAELAVSSIVPNAGGSSAHHNDVRIDSAQSLARQYERIRDEQESGPARTQAMTSVVRRMIESAGSLGEHELLTLLQSKQRGDRLLAYASTYALPQPALLEELITSVTAREDKPFGEYWGLQAIARNLPSGTQPALSQSALRALANDAPDPSAGAGSADVVAGALF